MRKRDGEKLTEEKTHLFFSVSTAPRGRSNHHHHREITKKKHSTLGYLITVVHNGKLCFILLGKKDNCMLLNGFKSIVLT